MKIGNIFPAVRELGAKHLADARKHLADGEEPRRLECDCALWLPAAETKAPAPVRNRYPHPIEPGSVPGSRVRVESDTHYVRHRWAHPSVKWESESRGNWLHADWQKKQALRWAYTYEGDRMRECVAVMYAATCRKRETELAWIISGRDLETI